MNILTLDCEATGATNGTKGNPFTEANRLCYVGCHMGNSYSDFSVEYDMRPYGRSLEEVRALVVGADLLVGFNLKYDLHWLRRYGITNYETKKIWDCQAVEFILSQQRLRFPSLEICCQRRGLPQKISVVKDEYWKKGIDTDQVPAEILREYLQQDVEITRQLYERQVDDVRLLPMATQRLVSLVNQDLLTLEEMESNGIHLDMEGCEKESRALEVRISNLYRTLSSFYPDIPMLWSSNDCVSAALYGGIVKEDYRESVQRVLKSGQISVKERWSVREHQLPTIVEPLGNSELAKPGYYKTDEGTLRKLRAEGKAKEIIKCLLETSKLEKLKGTYFDGFPKLYKEMGWTDNILHGQLNQVVVVTGRLSSNAPNQQNLPEDMRRLITTRF